MSGSAEELRLIKEYARRDSEFPWHDWRRNVYHPRHALGSLLREHNNQLLVETLNRLDLELAGLRILDVGCGYGAWLRNLVELGAQPENCTGVDLSSGRLEVARHKNASIAFQEVGIDALPFPDATFDIVLQSVVFSSIQDAAMRRACAAEMHRVTRAGGIVFWLDLIRTDSDTLVCFSEADVRGFFGGMSVVFKQFAQPGYFRRINGPTAWVARSLYQLTKLGCECQLIVFKKGTLGA